MDQSPSWNADNPSASHDIRHACGPRKFITVFTKAIHWALSWTRWIHFTSANHIL